MPRDLIHSVVPYFGCVIEPVPEGLKLTGASRDFMNAAAVATRAFKPPFRFRAVAMTDSTNLRLYWHIGEVIFNWECSIRELRVHDPATREQWGIKDQGFLTPGEWHEVIWEIHPTSMQVIADGRQRFACEGEYGGITAPVAIGPCFGSTVTVRELEVTEG
jgi:hypothetical protein